MVLDPALQKANLPIVGNPQAPANVDDADTIPRHQYAGEVSYLAPVHGSMRGESPFGLSLGYGLTGHTEVDLDLGSLSREPRYRRNERDDFGDLALSVKTRFFQRGATAVALEFQTTFLSADRTRNGDQADQSLSLVASQTLGKLQVTGNLGATAPGVSSERIVPLVGAAFVYDLHRGTALLAQVGENQPQNAELRRELGVAAGITQKVGEGLSFQALLGRSVRGNRNAGLFLGASYGFGGGR